MKISNNMTLLIYFIVSLLFMEIIFRIASAGNIFSLGLVLSFLFSVSVALLYFIICSFFREKINFMLSFIFLGISALIFSSQLVYFKFFRTYYSFYSATNGTQVFEFWKDTWTLVANNFFWIILFFLPAIFLIAYGNKVITFIKINSHFRLMLLCCIILVHILGLATIYVGGKEQHSPYDLYFQNRNLLLSSEKLGLITTMRIDMQRLLFNWSPVLAATPPLPKPDLNKGVGEKNEEEKKLEYNALNIDFAALIASEENKVINGMHNYFAEVEPTAKNEYTGKYAGYNLIFITAESFTPYAIREDVTPTLYKMVHEGYNFTNFYTPFWEVSTTDGEYVACTGLIPKSGIWSFQESGNIFLPFVMGNQLKSHDYKTVAYHNHTYTFYKRHISHPNMGYKYKGIGNGLKVKKTWPASDLEMMEKTISEYIYEEPFHAYYMTVSGHMQYSFSGNNMARKNKKYVHALPYSEQGKAYLATQIELDKALEHLLNRLEEAGIADKTLIVLSTDHYPYGLDDKTIDELAGHKVERNFEIFKSPFILYTKGMEPMTIDKPSSSLDIIPTLSNLLGLKYDSRLLMGRDIFSDAEPLVLFLNRSFITDKGSYNSITKEFIPHEEGIPFDENYVNWISEVVNNKFYYSAKILETDYYKKVLQSLE